MPKRREAKLEVDSIEEQLALERRGGGRARLTGLYKELKSKEFVLPGETVGAAAERLGIHKRRLERHIVSQRAIEGIESEALNYIVDESPTVRAFVLHFEKSGSLTPSILYGLLTEFEKKGFTTLYEGVLYVTYDGQIELERLEQEKTPWLSRSWGPRLERMFEDPGMDY